MVPSCLNPSSSERNKKSSFSRRHPKKSQHGPISSFHSYKKSIISFTDAQPEKAVFALLKIQRMEQHLFLDQSKEEQLSNLKVDERILQNERGPESISPTMARIDVFQCNFSTIVSLFLCVLHKALNISPEKT